MTLEQQFLLELLADYANGRPTAEAKELDWEILTKLARDQGLGAIAYLQCRDFLKSHKTAQEALWGAFSSAVFYDACRRQDLSEIAQAFSEARIPFMTVKGCDLAQYHPVPQLRTMGDIDMVIHTRDREQVDGLLSALGFGRKIDNHAVWTYFRDVVTYEIHDHIMYDPLANDYDYQGYFDRIWRYAAAGEGSRQVIDPSFHFLYLMTHTAKHIVSRGSGFRPFLDMVFFARQGGLNWPWITEQLQELRLLEFTRTCFSLCSRWFRVEMPLCVGQLTDSFLEEATEKVFLDGVFGLENQENDVGSTARAVKRSDRPYWLTALELTRKELFPPYRTMQLIPWYSFVHGRPWLLPAAWIYRFWYCAARKSEIGKEKLTRPFLKTEQIRQREQMIDSWGL